MSIMHGTFFCFGKSTNAGRTFLSQIFVKFGYVINSRKINTLYFAKKKKKCFFQLINEHLEKIFLV